MLLTKIKPVNKTGHRPLNSPGITALFFTVIFSACSFHLFAQNNTGNPRKDNGNRNITVLRDTTSIEDKLVELALKGPIYAQTCHQNKIAEYQLMAAKNQWMNLLTISTNYNDQTFASKTVQQTAYVYPKYFFGLNLPLGTLLSRTQVKAAKEALEMGKLNQVEANRTIRADVLSKYKQYQLATTLVNLQTDQMNDVQTALVQAEDKFKKGTITFEAYNTAQKLKNDETVKLLNLKLQQDLLRIELEKIIGVSLDSVLNSRTR